MLGMVLLSGLGLLSGGILLSGAASVYQVEQLSRLPADRGTSASAFARAASLLNSPFSCASGIFRRLAAFAADAAQDSPLAVDRLRWQGLADKAVSSAISCSRRDGNLYIVKAEIALISGDLVAAAEALHVSQRLSPHEAFAIARRLLLLTQFPPTQVASLLPWMASDAEQIERLNPAFKTPVLQAFRASDSETVRLWIVDLVSGR